MRVGSLAQAFDQFHRAGGFEPAPADTGPRCSGRTPIVTAAPTGAANDGAGKIERRQGRSRQS